MKLLLDACVPRPVRRFLVSHEVLTAQEVGWAELKNGDLLREAESEFYGFITTDKNLRYQQNLAGRKIAILVLPTNDWPALARMPIRIATAVDGLKPGDYLELEAGDD